MKRPLALMVLAVSGASAFAVLPSDNERTYKLNGPLAESPVGSVVGYELTPDNARVVYLSLDTGGPVLLSVPVDGSIGQVELNAPMPAGQMVTEFHLTPDGALAVYRADQDVNNKYELYAVPVDGSQPPTKLSGEIPDDRDVRGIVALTPDGAHAVYRADASTDQVNELFSVPVDGSAPPTRLNGMLGSSQRIEPDFQVTPDGARVVFRTNTFGASELFSVPVDGSELPVSLGETGAFESMQVSPDSSLVVYLSIGDLPGFQEVFSVPIDGSAQATKLNGPLAADGDVGSFGISPDSSRVVYVADQDLDGVDEIYGVPSDGSASEVKLNTPLLAGIDVGVSGFRIAPDSSYVAFRATEDVAVQAALFSAPLDGSFAAIQLTGNDVDEVDFEISTDSSRVVYLRDDDGDKLFSAPLDGNGSPLLLSPLASAPRPVRSFHLAPTGGQVVYELGFVEIHSVPFDGSAPSVQLVPDFYLSDDLELRITADGTHVVYLADLTLFPGIRQLHGVPIDGSQPASVLSESRVGTLTGRVLTYEYSPDGRWVVYTAWGDTHTATELYSVRVDRSSPPVKLNTTVVLTGDIYQYTITPDSSGVVYRGDQDQDEVFELYHAPIDGSQPATRLNDPLGPDADVGWGAYNETSYAVSPDSRSAVFMADIEVDGFYDLYSVPLDGSASPVRLTSQFADELPVPGFQITADSARVVYGAEQDAVDVNELYSVPLDGSAAPIRLSADMPALGDLVSFQLTADATHAIYIADQTVNGRNELFAVPVDGSAAPVPLSGSLTANGNVYSFAIAPDSSRVVYRADAEVNEQYELYSVLVDGTGRVQLNSEPDVDGDVALEYEITPDSAGVVFYGDVRVNDRQELFHVPIDTAGGQVRLHGDIVELGEIKSWRISPDSSRVVFNADLEQNNWERLYSVPTTGGPVTRVNAPLPPFGDVQPVFEISPDSSYVIYRADQETNGLLEIYAVPIDGRLEAPYSVRANDAVQDDVYNFRPTPDSDRVVYLTSQGVVFELYATDLVPRVARVSPRLGPASGGNTVTLHGRGFTPDAEVWIGGRPATEVTYLSASRLRVTVPSNSNLAPPTTGPPSGGKLRRATLPRLEVDVEISIAGIGSTLETGYTYAPAVQR